VSFVRTGGLESGQLLPVALSELSLEVLIENVKHAKRVLPVPFAVENVATLLRWPSPSLSEPEFLRRLCEGADCGFLLDLSNLDANARNFGFDAQEELLRLPLERVAYLHVAGGIERGGLYHDTHAHPLPAEAVALLRSVRRRGVCAGVLLERDDRFPPMAALDAELRALEGAGLEEVADDAA
jgi:hypothetical protein